MGNSAAGVTGSLVSSWIASSNAEENKAFSIVQCIGYAFPLSPTMAAEFQSPYYGALSRM